MTHHPVFVGQVGPALIVSSNERQTVLMTFAVHQQREAQLVAYRARVEFLENHLTAGAAAKPKARKPRAAKKPTSRLAPSSL